MPLFCTLNLAKSFSSRYTTVVHFFSGNDDIVHRITVNLVDLKVATIKSGFLRPWGLKVTSVSILS
ncbi:hypothetical protein XM72_c12409 [Vibrio vulnificus]|nr:hypothetical protein XM72_c12409 [Vibrio vulnificus]SUP12135.1 Uncharacterised protein [Vibrio vulnificus]